MPLHVNRYIIGICTTINTKILSSNFSPRKQLISRPRLITTLMTILVNSFKTFSQVPRITKERKFIIFLEFVERRSTVMKKLALCKTVQTIITVSKCYINQIKSEPNQAVFQSTSKFLMSPASGILYKQWNINHTR